MSGCCAALLRGCGCKGGTAREVSVSAKQQLQQQLFALERRLPGTPLVTLLGKDGKFIAYSGAQESPFQSDDAMLTIAALRRSAVKFAFTLDQNDWHSMHITGEESVFSCYDVHGCIIAFYSELQAMGFNSDKIDDVVKPQLEAIKESVALLRGDFPSDRI
mmetsp:Transcript_15235/g.45112  ORF Transcript_15235/g.45112 Transcript_15235/m.45112 type:complete len:161 (-) Transcript_15235:433-915(-)